MRHGLLAGAIPLAGLEDLARVLRAHRGDVDDPRLADLLDHIDLRAAVELAKLSWSA
ncbi:MAG: flagellar assembly protein FliX [Dongiaceae bacterium]